MIAGLKQIIVKFALFATLSIILVVILLNTMLNPVPGKTEDYQAMFHDVSGLRVGDDIRAAGVRVGRVTSIDVAPGEGARVGIEVRDEQPLLANTRVVMRYQNLVGQRYLALVQPNRRGDQLEPGSTIGHNRTDPGFDLTELLNGFRPLFEVLNPADVNELATTLIAVLQGEGGTVDSLLGQTAQLTNYVADRDALIEEVIVNLTPVLDNITAQGPEIDASVAELTALMEGLAAERETIGTSIDGVSQLIVSTSDLLTEAREPSAQAVRRFRTVAKMLADSRDEMTTSLDSFAQVFGALGRATSYENALNVYVCSAIVSAAGQTLNLGGSNSGPFSEVCK
ncbi:MCE family protein [Nocardioides limicola]|uniref:MCE family protein n=1 Tax=Nocardioides limicola TaxID=2803368 RepID=UPI00193C1034|nr:MlaD family protein [Nocardioides sp. DJM-14]